ncbi:hypothetical protein [Haloarcula litorea]|nr:hypothetical protein [Halomicroarcula sp. GDY20]
MVGFKQFLEFILLWSVLDVAVGGARWTNVRRARQSATADRTAPDERRGE